MLTATTVQNAAAVAAAAASCCTIDRAAACCTIDRAACRRHPADVFSAGVCVLQYLCVRSLRINAWS